MLIAAQLSLAGCSEAPSQVRRQEATVETVDSREQTTGAPEAPEVELSQELLYKLLVAEFAGQRGALPLSAKLYLDAAEETRDPRLAKHATQIAVYGRDSKTALQAARLWAELSPEELDARHSLAALLIRDNQADEAVPHLEKVLSLSRNNKNHNFQAVANLMARDHDKEQALTVMKRLIEPYRDDPDALYAYAQLANQLGADAEAESTLEKLLQLEPEHTQALLLQARVLHRRGNAEAALNSLRQALEQAPDNHQLRLTYARMLVDTHQLPEARKQFKIINRLQPENNDVIYALGLLAMEAGDIDEADIHFTQLVANGEREAEARLALGEIAEARKRPQEAIEWYRSIPEGENYMSGQLQAARLIAREQGVDAARNALRQLPLHEPEDQIQRYLAEAELLAGMDRLEEAMAVYDEALTRFNDNPDLLYSRALMAEKLDRLDILERDLRRILENDPENTQALNALGYTLTDRTGRHQEALGYIEQAYRQKPDDPSILDSMGWVLYHLGRTEEARKYLQQAADKLDDGEIAAHLGEVLWALGRKEEARKVWEKALKLTPEHKVLQQTIERYTP
jgi:tetratricopeptide (TPR) repeat protein